MMYVCYVKEKSKKWEQKFCNMNTFALMIWYFSVPHISIHARPDQKVSGLRL